jgi:hypothetical protein
MWRLIKDIGTSINQQVNTLVHKACNIVTCLVGHCVIGDQQAQQVQQDQQINSEHSSFEDIDRVDIVEDEPGYITATINQQPRRMSIPQLHAAYGLLSYDFAAANEEHDLLLINSHLISASKYNFGSNNSNIIFYVFERLIDKKKLC